MKNLTQKVVGIFVLTGLMFCGSLQAMTIDENDKSTEVSIMVKDDLIGGWEYTVAGAPEGYEKGFMMIVKQSGVYKVQVQLSNGAVNGDNVEVKGKKITFDVTIEGETVKIALEAKGSKITGTSTSPSNGTMNISGVKSISPQ